MRRIELAPGQVFEEKMLNRVGAFNADALVAATNIVEDVRKRGDEALREYTAKFDGVEMEEFRVSQEAIDEAIAKVDPKPPLSRKLLPRSAISMSVRSSRVGSPCAKMALWSVQRWSRSIPWVSTFPAAEPCTLPRF